MDNYRHNEIRLDERILFIAVAAKKKKNKLKNKFFKKYAFISYQYKILPKFKKRIEFCVGTSPMDWLYKEK